MTFRSTEVERGEEYAAFSAADHCLVAKLGECCADAARTDQECAIELDW